MNRKAFYDSIRVALGPFKPAQVEGFELLLNEAIRRKTVLDRLAYILATTWWETAKTMQPVKEAYWVKNAEAWRKANLRYYPYYGRSYPQLTWKANYEKAQAWFRTQGIIVDLVGNPDLVMDPKYGVPILFEGMEAGWFTGKKLADYLDGIDGSDVEDLREFTNARRIVNGTDKAAEIGKLGLVFEKALRAAEYGEEPSHEGNAKLLWDLYVNEDVEVVDEEFTLSDCGFYSTIVLKDDSERFWLGEYQVHFLRAENSWRDGYSRTFVEVEPYVITTTAYRPKAKQAA